MGPRPTVHSKCGQLLSNCVCCRCDGSCGLEHERDGCTLDWALGANTRCKSCRRAINEHNAKKQRAQEEAALQEPEMVVWDDGTTSVAFNAAKKRAPVYDEATAEAFNLLSMDTNTSAPSENKPNASARIACTFAFVGLPSIGPVAWLNAVGSLINAFW